MDIKRIINIYQKEREYEHSVFGNYADDKSLSFPSFLLFLEQYIEKAKKAYTEKWETELPPWLLSCAEFENHGVAPVKAYEEIIKVLALAGAALETYALLDPSEWRANAEKDALKWK